MRSLRWLAAVTGTLALGSACGGGDDVGPNQPPAANFTQSCTNLVCNFDDTSTDDGSIASWSWNFGDPNSGDANNVSTVENPAHTFSAAGPYTVSLTVTDNNGEQNTKTNPVTVTAANAAPTAGFTYTCNAGLCQFTSTSTDADGTIATYAWNFGEPASGTNTSNLEDPGHTFAAAGNYTVTLTVTDNAGGTDVETQTVPISQDLVCTDVDCTIVLTQAATVTITVTTSDCQFIGNQFEITQPIQESVFADGCTVDDGTVFPINGGAAFTAGTSIQTRFIQGVKPRPADPDPGPAATRVSGSFPTWTIEIDDGGNSGRPGEPDFNDIVLTVTAAP